MLLQRTFKESLIYNNQVWPNEKTEEFICLITELTTYNETLPQGAPTSPLLFFLVIEESRLITKLFYVVQPMKISCYVDGFVVSGPHLPDARMREKIFKCLEESGFEANFKRTRQFDCRQGAPLVVGLRINGLEKRVSLPKKTIRKWRGIIYRAATTTDPCEKTDLALRIEGFMASLRPIYKFPPAQLLKPYRLFRHSIKNRRPIEEQIPTKSHPAPVQEKEEPQRRILKEEQTCLNQWM